MHEGLGEVEKKKRLQIVGETCEAHGLMVNMSDGIAEFTIEMVVMERRNDSHDCGTTTGTAQCSSTKTGCGLAL